LPAILRSAGHRLVRWKNDGGSTAEVVVQPPSASIESFDWRGSIATIERDSDFSSFPGVDRTLAVLGAAPLTLHVEGRPAFRLTTESPPFRFPGELRVRATVADGPSTDFNVMTRRERYAHRVERRAVAGSSPIANRAGTTLVLVAKGSVTMRDGDRVSVDLGEADAAVLVPRDGAGWTVHAAGAVLLIVEITGPRRSR
jgi:uncharacterized protein